MRAVMLMTVLLFLSGCVLFQGRQLHFQQGNVISQSQLAQLRKGMSAEKVEAILGSPVMENPLAASSWDYIYTKHDGAKILAERCIRVYFKRGRYVRYAACAKG